LKNKKYLLKGQSMFEVVVAIFIMALIIVGVIILSTNSISNSSFSKNKTLAGRYAQEAIEWLRSQRDADMTIFTGRVSAVPYCLTDISLANPWSNIGTCTSTEVIPETSFRREASLSTSQISLKNVIEATVVVYWSDSKGSHEVRSVTNFTDIREK